MRVISKFHDYYDSSLAFGNDPTVLFIRKTETYPFKSKQEQEFYENFKNFHGETLQSLREGNFQGELIGFCGQLVPVICHTYDVVTNQHVGLKETRVDYIYDYETAARVHEEKYQSKERQRIYKKRWWNRGSLEEKFTLEKFFSQKPSDKFWNIFLKTKIPYFHYESSSTAKGGRIHMNPVLSKLQFYKHKNPYICFQEIEQFISGVLGGSSPELYELNNEEKIVKAGFDKYSFRKPPTKNKKKVI